MNDDELTERDPLADATPEDGRYTIEIHSDRIVSVLDGETAILTFGGPDALANALAHRVSLADRAARGLSDPTPASFLAETLPAYARRQRLESYLAEVRECESTALAMVVEAAETLRQAVNLRERLEKALSTTEPAERAPGVRQDTPAFRRLQREAQRLRLVRDSNLQDPTRRTWPTERTPEFDRNGCPVSKPQPY